MTSGDFLSKLTNTLLQVFFTKVSVLVTAVSAAMTLVVRAVAAVSIAVHLAVVQAPSAVLLMSLQVVLVQELSVNVLISALDFLMSFSFVPTRRFVSSTLLLTAVVCTVPTPMAPANDAMAVKTPGVKRAASACL